MSNRVNLSREQLDFSGATICISDAQKFVLPVPAAPGQPLVYPSGYQDPKSGEDLSGKPIVDWEGKPKFEDGATGYVFFNYADSSVQGCRTDGNAIIIVNEVRSEDVPAIEAEIARYADDPRDLTLDELTAVREFISALGYSDQYDSDLKFDAENFTPVYSDRQLSDASGQPIPGYGFKKRDARDICTALYQSGAGEYVDGPSATPQRFEDGAVLVLQPRHEPRLVQADVFLRTYKKPCGTTFAGVDELASV